MMRIYTNALEAVREVERDLFEMGISVHPQTMQDKHVADDPAFMTKELQGYSFKLSGHEVSGHNEFLIVNYLMTGKKVAENGDRAPQVQNVLDYIWREFEDRVSGEAFNPGKAYTARPDVWGQFLHDGKFAYTYSERIAPQLDGIVKELRERPNTRQAIINIHSNICPHPGKALEEQENGEETHEVSASQDMWNMGGNGRIPCSMYYQFLRRKGKMDMIYTMRSCDLLTHFYVDLCLALRMQKHMAMTVGDKVGDFTYFAGSLHAYQKDLNTRGIF